MKNLNPIYLLNEGKYSSDAIRFLDNYLPLWHTRANQIASNTRLNRKQVAELARKLKLNTAIDAINKTTNEYDTQNARLALVRHMAKSGGLLRGLNEKDSIKAVLNSNTLSRKQKAFIIKMIKNGEPLNILRFFDISA